MDIPVLLSSPYLTLSSRKNQQTVASVFPFVLLMIFAHGRAHRPYMRHVYSTEWDRENTDFELA